MSKEWPVAGRTPGCRIFPFKFTPCAAANSNQTSHRFPPPAGSLSKFAHLYQSRFKYSLIVRCEIDSDEWRLRSGDCHDSVSAIARLTPKSRVQRSRKERTDASST